MFNSEDGKTVYDEEKWFINEDNMIEFIEAIHLDRYFDEDELNRLISKYSSETN